MSLIFFNEKNEKDLDNFWHRKLTLKVRNWHFWSLDLEQMLIWHEKVLLFTQLSYHLMRKLMKNSWMLSKQHVPYTQFLPRLQLGSYCLNIYGDRKKETVIGEAQRKCETMHNSFVFCLVNFFFSFFHVLPCHVCMFLLFFFCTSFLSKQEIKGVNMQDRRKKKFPKLSRLEDCSIFVPDGLKLILKYHQNRWRTGGQNEMRFQNQETKDLIIVNGI